MNITLIGMPGAGKSYMGKIIAKKLKFSFIDTDKLLEGKFKKELQDIVSEIGNERFIGEETKSVLELKDQDNVVISPGGSIVYSPKAMKHLKEISRVVFLNTPLTMIKSRIDQGSRGIIGLKDKTLEDIFNERLPLYFKYADVVVNDSEDKTTEDLFNEIMRSF